MKRRSEATISVTLDVPARPIKVWEVQCPHCHSDEIRCWNLERLENYSFGYHHNARQHALEGAQKMWDQMMVALTRHNLVITKRRKHEEEEAA